MEFLDLLKQYQNLSPPNYCFVLKISFFTGLSGALAMSGYRMPVLLLTLFPQVLAPLWSCGSWPTIHYFAVASTPMLFCALWRIKSTERSVIARVDKQECATPNLSCTICRYPRLRRNFLLTSPFFRKTRILPQSSVRARAGHRPCNVKPSQVHEAKLSKRLAALAS